MALPLAPLDPVAGHALAGAAALVLLIGAVQKTRDWPAFRSALVALALLAAVTGAVAINLARGRADIDCGCGGAEGGQRLSWALVGRNAMLMAAIAVGAQQGSARALGALDYATLVFASLALYGLYACASQLLANRPHLSDLRASVGARR